MNPNWVWHCALRIVQIVTIEAIVASDRIYIHVRWLKIIQKVYAFIRLNGFSASDLI